MGKIKPFYYPKGTPIISHLFYADDIVVFSNGRKSSLRAILNVLKNYEDWSGQMMNKKKSSVLFSKHIPVARRKSLLGFISFMEGSFHFTYLGFPIVSGRFLSLHFDDMINKIRSRFEGWKARLLSNGARLSLLNHVLQSIPIHCLLIL